MRSFLMVVWSTTSNWLTKRIATSRSGRRRIGRSCASQDVTNGFYVGGSADTDI